MTAPLLPQSETSIPDGSAEMPGMVRDVEMFKLIAEARQSIVRSTEQLDEIKRFLANSEHAA
jgi:hypothetical protein